MLVCGVRRKFASSRSESRYTRTGHEKRDISRIRSTFWGGGRFKSGVSSGILACAHVSELTARVSSRVEMMETTEMTAIAKA